MTENELKEKLVDAIYTIVKRVPDFDPDYHQIAKNGADVIMNIIAENDWNTHERLQALKNRIKDNCVSCIHYKATEPCWKANNSEVQKWLNMEGKYADPKLACPEWYDEY